MSRAARGIRVDAPPAEFRSKCNRSKWFQPAPSWRMAIGLQLPKLVSRSLFIGCAYECRRRFVAGQCRGDVGQRSESGCRVSALAQASR